MYSFTDIVKRIKSRLQNSTSTIEGTFTMDNVQAVSQELAMIHSTEIAPIIDTVFWDTAQGQNLDRRAADIQITRHEAQVAVGKLEFKGKPKTFVPAGTTVRYETLLYSTTEAVRVGSDGTAIAAAKCLTAGTVGNIPAGLVTTIVTFIDGLANVTNLVPFEAGANREEDTAFRERCIERLRYPDTSGNEHYYEFRAKEVPGVGKAKCKGCWAGPGTVKLVLLSAEGGVPDNTTIEKVKQHVEAHRLIGADITYVGAVPRPITISGRLLLTEGFSLLDVVPAIREEFENYFNEIAFDNTTAYLSYHKAIEMIFRASGVADMIELLLNGQKETVPIGYDEFCTLQEVSFLAN